ncbi:MULTISPECIES: hypothetical protein [Bacillus]|uniref:hypothetical protein n=1 Tax=Bacillus TaxID=1386 RepID=UPI00086E462D|nr:hypothetical protein [Bacillus wiedmannii]SCN08032.1 Uncharacterized protein BCRIVMBC126_02347 [Bacillus wiedmannii]
MNEGHFLILQDLIITLEKTVKNIQNTVVLNARTKLEKKIQNTAKVTGDTVLPQEPTIKISIQLLVQIEFQK